MSEIAEMLKLLREVRDSPTLGEASNAVVVSPKTWQRIVEITEGRRGRRGRP